MSSIPASKTLARDRAGNTVRFLIPTVADGHVILGTRGRIDTYGLLTPATPTK